MKLIEEFLVLFFRCFIMFSQHWQQVKEVLPEVVYWLYLLANLAFLQKVLRYSSELRLRRTSVRKLSTSLFSSFLSSLDYHWGHESLSLTLLRALKEKRPKKSSNQIPVNSGKSSRYHSNSSFEIERGPWHSSWISGTIQIQNFILSNLGGWLEAKPYGLDRYLVPNRFAPLISPYLIKISK